MIRSVPLDPGKHPRCNVQFGREHHKSEGTQRITGKYNRRCRREIRRWSCCNVQFGREQQKS
eukprot:scaffold167226_cov28-Attheya_sp.AAC.1